MDKYPEDLAFRLTRASLKEFPNIPTDTVAVDIRRNKIKMIPPIENDKIKYLDISDNLIRDISPLLSLKSLEVLDCSYNLLENIPRLNLHKLKELYLIANDIERIENIEFESLVKLDIANNSIKKIENIHSEFIEELYLGANTIKSVENIKHLKNLKILDLQYNEIEELDASEIPETVEILLLQGNKKLKIVRNIESLINLKTLGIKNTKVLMEDGKNFEFW